MLDEAGAGLVAIDADVDGVELHGDVAGARAMRWRRCSAQALRSRSPAGLKLVA